MNVPSDADKAVVEKYLKREYEFALKALDEQYRYQLQAKDEQIAIYRQQGTNIIELAKLMAARPINVEAKAVVEDKSVSKTSNYDLRNSQFGGGLVDAETVNAHQVGGDVCSTDCGGK